jgi:DNA-binding transcriptional MerR regulator
MDTFDYKKYLAENKLNENSEEAIRKAVKIYYSEKSKEDILEELFKILDNFLKERGMSYDDVARALKAQGHDIDVDIEDPVQAKRKELFGKKNEELEEQTRNPMPRYELKKVFDDVNPDDVQKVKDGYYGISDGIMTLSDGLGSIEDKVSAASLDQELAMLNKIKMIFDNSRIGEIL